MNRSSLFRRLGFRTKISLSIIAILLVFGLGLSFIISRYVSQALLSENKTRGISSGLNLSARVVEPLLSMDFLALKTLVDESLRNDKDVVYTFLLDKAGQPLVHTYTGGFPVDLKSANAVPDSEPYRIQVLSASGELIHDFAFPVLIGKDRLGTVRTGMSHRRVQEVVNRLLWTIFLSIGIGVLLVGFVSAALARTVTRRIQALHRAAEEIVKGNLDVQTAQRMGNPCWQMVNCGQTQCPAYGDPGRRCWHLAGTLCPACADGEYPAKLAGCRKCPVYRSGAGDEIQDLAEFFDIMALTLKDRLETIKQTQERLLHSQRLETIGQLAAGVAHEINTPLGIILGYAQLSKEDAEKGTELHENLSTIEKYARVCRSIVSDLLRFSRQTESVKRSLDINQLVTQLTAVVEHTFGLERVTIQKHLSADLPPVFGDQEKLEQALMNLINNAYDAIGTDGTITIATHPDPDAGEVVITVSDTGKGIAPEIRDRIFDPFFTTKGVGRGTGLGLSVTFGIIKDHGGRIEFQSTPRGEGREGTEPDPAPQPRSGTVFTIRLPARRRETSGTAPPGSDPAGDRNA